MTSLQTADGRVLRSRRPSGVSVVPGGGPFGSSGMFPPLWSNGERAGDDDPFEDGVLRSFENIYRSQAAVAGVVDKLTRRIATLPLVAYKTADDGSKTAVTEDSLATLLKRPMPGRTTAHLIAHVEQSLLIHGNGLVAKVRGNDPEAPPEMLWPIDWSRVSAYGTVGGTIEWWSTAQFDNIERFIAAKDVIHFAWPAPDGAEIGVSPLEKLGVVVRLEDAVVRHQTGMFRNGMRPSLAVTYDNPNVKGEQLDYARNRVEQMHKGVDNAGRAFFMGANVKVQPLSLSPVEVALIDQRKLNREEIGMVYDMAGPLMGDFTHATYSNVTETLRSLYRDVVPPWTELIVQTLQAQLIDLEPAWLDRYARFDFSDKLKGDPNEQAVVDRSDVEAGIRTRDEAREGRGLKPMGGLAAQLSANTNNQAPVESMGANSDSPPPGVNGR